MAFLLPASYLMLPTLSGGSRGGVGSYIDPRELTVIYSEPLRGSDDEPLS